MVRAPLLLLVLLSSCATAPLPTGEVRDALNGLDPVELCDGREVAGQEELSAEHNRYRYRFASVENRARFAADPERWGIQWSGACGRMGPLSGRGSPDRWTVHDGHIFVFASDGCRERFVKSPERYMDRDSTAQPSPEQRAAGRARLDAAVAAHGGAERVDALRALRGRSVKMIRDWTAHSELVCDAQGRVRHEVVYEPPAGSEHGVSRSLWVVDTTPFTVEDDQLYLLSAAESAEVTRRARRWPLAVLWGRRASDFSAADVGDSVLEGTAVRDVAVRWGGASTTLHMDASTGRIAGMSWFGRIGDGIVKRVTEVYDDWRDVDGVMMPFSSVVSVAGEEVETTRWSELEPLLASPAEAFAPPAAR